MLYLPARETANNHNGGTGHRSLNDATLRWRVKWKPETPTLLQTNAAEISAGTLISDSYANILQVQARPIRRWRETTGTTMNMHPPNTPNPFTGGNVYITAGPNAIVQAGTSYGNYNYTNNIIQQQPALEPATGPSAGSFGGPAPPYNAGPNATTTTSIIQAGTSYGDFNYSNNIIHQQPTTGQASGAYGSSGPPNAAGFQGYYYPTYGPHPHSSGGQGPCAFVPVRTWAGTGHMPTDHRKLAVSLAPAADMQNPQVQAQHTLEISHTGRAALSQASDKTTVIKLDHQNSNLTQIVAHYPSTHTVRDGIQTDQGKGHTDPGTMEATQTAKGYLSGPLMAPKSSHTEKPSPMYGQGKLLPANGIKGRWEEGMPVSMKEAAHPNGRVLDSKEQRPLDATNLQVIKAPRNGSCFFHAVSFETNQSAKQLRTLVANAVPRYANTIAYDMTVSDWIKADTGLTPNEYVKYLKHGGWGGQVDLFLLAQILYRPFCVYIRSTSTHPDLLHTFEPIHDPKQLRARGNPVRLLFGNSHYDAIIQRRLAIASSPMTMRASPAQPCTRVVESESPVEKTDKIMVSPHVAIKTDESTWTRNEKGTINDMRTQRNVSMQDPQHACAPRTPTTIISPKSECNVQASTTGAVHARNLRGQPNDHRLEMAPISPPRSKRAQHHHEKHRKDKHPVGRHVVGVKWPRDMEKADERQEEVLRIFRKDPEQKQEQSIVEHIGGMGSVNRTRRTRTRRILSRLLLDNILERKEEDRYGWRVLVVGRAFPSKFSPTMGTPGTHSSGVRNGTNVAIGGITGNSTAEAAISAAVVIKPRAVTSTAGAVKFDASNSAAVTANGDAVNSAAVAAGYGAVDSATIADNGRTVNAVVVGCGAAESATIAVNGRAVNSNADTLSSVVANSTASHEAMRGATGNSITEAVVSTTAGIKPRAVTSTAGAVNIDSSTSTAITANGDAVNSTERPAIQVWVRLPPSNLDLQRAASRFPMDACGPMTGTMILITTRLTDLVRDLKFAIQTHLGVSPGNILDWTLRGGGKTMDEQNTLGHYKVQDGYTIEVGVRLRGGLPAKTNLGQRKVSSQQQSNLNLFEHTSKQLTEAAAQKRASSAGDAGVAMGDFDLEKRSQWLMEEGERHTLAAQARSRQEEDRLKTAKLLKEEIEVTLQPLGLMEPKELQVFNRTVNVALELTRAQMGGISEHKSHLFIKWMMAKIKVRCETGKIISDKIIQEGLRQPGSRSVVRLIARSRMENYADRETSGRCPTDNEVKTFFNSMAEFVNISILPSDDSDKLRQGTDFGVTLTEARHNLTNQVAQDCTQVNAWRFDLSIEPPGSERLCLIPTHQEHNLAKFRSWISCLRASTQHQGCADTAVENALLAGLLPSWRQELPQFVSNLIGFRLEHTRLVWSKAGKIRIKPPLASLGLNSFQAPQLFIHIGRDQSQESSLADITRDILNLKATLQLNMVAEKDKTLDNIITFSIAPRQSQPATGQEEAWGRLKDKMRQERQLLTGEWQQIIHISSAMDQGREEHTPEVAEALIRSICQDVTGSTRSHSSHSMGTMVLEALENKGIGYIQEILYELEPDAYVAVKISGFPIFKKFFSDCQEVRKYSATQKTSAFLQLIRNHLHERGVPTEAVEVIYEVKKNDSDEELLAAFTASSWRMCTSAPAQGEPILSAVQNSVKRRLKPVDTIPFRILGNLSKQAPVLIFTPIAEETPDGIDEEQTVLSLLQGGDLIFVPTQKEVHSFQRSTTWSEIPTIQEWPSLQMKSISGLRRPEAAPGILWGLLDKGVVRLVEMRNKTANMWIFAAYLDAILTLEPGVLKDICPSLPRDTNKHLVLDPIKEAMKKGLLLHSIRGVWLENNPFDTTTIGSHLADQTKEIFPPRDSAALPLAITTMISVAHTLGQGLSVPTIQVIQNLVEAELIEPILKKGHTLLIRRGSDLRTAILQTDKIRVGSHYNSITMEVPEEDVVTALETTIQRIFPAGWGIVLLSVGADAAFPFESNDFEPQLQSEDPLHITNTGSHLLSQGFWTLSSQILKRWRQQKGIIQLPLSRPRGILWLYLGFQEPPNGSTFRTLTQVLGPQHGNAQFLSVLSTREDLDSSSAVLNVLLDCRQQAILAELHQAVHLRAFFIPGHTIQLVDGKRRAVPTQKPDSNQVRPSWLPRLSMTSNGTEILQAALSALKNDPSGIAVHPLEHYGVLLTKLDQFESIDLPTVMSALPAALQKEPVSLAELTGEMEYVLNFEEDRGEGSGGPSPPSS